MFVNMKRLTKLTKQVIQKKLEKKNTHPNNLSSLARTSCRICGNHLEIKVFKKRFCKIAWYLLIIMYIKVHNINATCEISYKVCLLRTSKPSDKTKNKCRELVMYLQQLLKYQQQLACKIRCPNPKKERNVIKMPNCVCIVPTMSGY